MTIGLGAILLVMGLVNLKEVVYAATLHRLTLTERRAKVLKGISGALLVVFGVLFVVAPDALQSSGAPASR